MPAWWDKKYGKNSVCGITHVRLRPGKNKFDQPYVHKLKECKHMFYRSALQNWIIECFKSGRDCKCPLCRKNINPIPVFKKF